MTNRARRRHMTNTIAFFAFCVAAGVAQAADSAYPSRPISTSCRSASKKTCGPLAGTVDPQRTGSTLHK